MRIVMLEKKSKETNSNNGIADYWQYMYLT
jgi:hypothetical protein